ncbi:DNA polymerase III subunit gamma/tau [Candidatus Vallotiella sp. (ex Adelges kitamiensis)]|uniref:DNA polymerase III subunit gamma/tau n=1 Tax=Candidatus Vallotiella sp. (ex Adelges kitamiensis) TaxID=2864217 RepID=UPI001CE3391A|nr:DNA polymerase III subunit gamma/tau [Candidatus Vallotia sp. (ex Adelges kitamiensis)]
MIYQVLARKWRPKDFGSLVGQEHVVRALTHILKAQRLHHAYLFTGTRGVGKTTLSRILAKALNCEAGITDTPCGTCSACLEIEGGYFVDYVEIDAASNRGVDEMSVLLERAVYAPVNARFKVYMIDEVHMLTQHAFHSMLKMLEEPPLHVKFILATTDPRKIPVTVLSRCLQFNLKRVPISYIVSHLEHILAQEGVGFETKALRLLSRAADGSIRDALSLTDQAIGHAAGTVITERTVRSMLGALDQIYLVQLLNAIAMHDGAKVLSLADEITARSLSFSTALQDLSGFLHRIAWAQVVPDSVLDEWPEAEDIRHFAEQFTPETVQLYYQIATIGRSELGLAPDGYAGFTMTLLRMLVFDTVNTTYGSAEENTPPTIGIPVGSMPSTKDLTASSIYTAEAEQTVAVYFPRKPKAIKSETDVNKVMRTEKLHTKVVHMNTTCMSDSSTNSSSVRAYRLKLDEMNVVNMSNTTLDTIEADSSQLASANNMATSALPQITSLWPNLSYTNSLASTALSMLQGQVLRIASKRSCALTVEVRTPQSAQSIYPESAAAVTACDNTPPENEINVPNFAAIVDNLTLNSDMSLKSLGYNGDWPTLAASLSLRGIAYQLALNSEFIACNHDELILRVSVPQYADVVHVSKLKSALELALDRLVHVTVSIGSTCQTASAAEIAWQAHQQQKAEKEINSDPLIQTLIRDFGATIISGSIRPLTTYYQA